MLNIFIISNVLRQQVDNSEIEPGYFREVVSSCIIIYLYMYIFTRVIKISCGTDIIQGSVCLSYVIRTSVVCSIATSLGGGHFIWPTKLREW